MIKKKVRFFNFLEKLEDLAALDLNSPVAPNCQSQEALSGHTRPQSRRSPPQNKLKTQSASFPSLTFLPL